MNRKAKYSIPVFAAVFALVFAFATPYVMADEDADKTSKDGAKYHKRAMQVDGFVGQIPVTENTDKATLRGQVTVSLSEAAAGLDVIKGKLGKVSNENGEKFLVWKLISKEKSDDGMTVTVHIVDAGNAANKAQITKEFSFKDRAESSG